jgi:hypothetical protein
VEKWETCLVVVPLLVRVLTRATRYLHLDAVGIYTIGDLQALVAKNLDHASGECPLLGRTTIAWLDGDPRAVAVRGGVRHFPG